MTQPEFYAGTSGLVLPVPNKAAYPPEFQDKSRLCYYASLFNSIEINSSFYKIPQAATLAGGVKPFHQIFGSRLNFGKGSRMKRVWRSTL